jgi:hypothetical protein
MAGLATHLIVAREVIGLLPEETIHNIGQYYAGSIAPDAIHAREGFVRADKKHTHLRDNIPDDVFHEKENLQLFHERITKLILHCREEKENLDFFRGYLVHLLTDELFVLSIRREFTEKMKELGIASEDKEYYVNIVTDMNRNDFLLVENYEGIEEIKNHLEKVEDVAIGKLLSKDEIHASRDWVINRYFSKPNQVEQPVYISYSRMLEFVHMAAEDIVFRLSGRGNLPKLL